MKKTTYWVIGMFITSFLFSIGVMIYFKYFNSITPIYAKSTTMNVNNVKVLKIDDGNPNYRSFYNLKIASENNANTNKITYPKDWIKAVQKGDTLILSLFKDEKNLEKLHNNPPTLVFSIAHSTKTLDLILGERRISDTKLMGLKLNQCSIKGSSYSDITAQTCTIDKFDIAAGGTVQVPDSKIKSLQILVDNTKLFKAPKYDIENLYLIGSNDNNDPSEIDLTKIKHVYIKPSKGKTIATRTSSNAEIYLGKD